MTEYHYSYRDISSWGSIIGKDERLKHLELETKLEQMLTEVENEIKEGLLD